MSAVNFPCLAMMIDMRGSPNNADSQMANTIRKLTPSSKPGSLVSTHATMELNSIKIIELRAEDKAINAPAVRRLSRNPFIGKMYRIMAKTPVYSRLSISENIT